MNAIFRVFVKDLTELIANPRLLVLSFVIAPAILLLVGQLNVRPPQINVLISGLEACDASDAHAEMRGVPQGTIGAEFITIPHVYSDGERTAAAVSKLQADGPADDAALREGDLILGIDGMPIATHAELQSFIARSVPGREVRLKIGRPGSQPEIPVTIAEAPRPIPVETVLFRQLSELSNVSVQCRRQESADPFEAISEMDLLVNVATRDSPGNDLTAQPADWSIYLKETHPRRLVWLMELAGGIQLLRSVDGRDAGTQNWYAMGLLGAVPLQSATLYFPQAADKQLIFLPMTFCLIACFLAFVLAVPSLIRERELHTLEIMLAAPGIHGRTILAGKLLLPVAASLIAALIMAMSMQVVYGLYVKEKSLQFFGFLLLPILSSALTGLLVSAIARTHVQAMLAAATYFFCLLLLSGFLYPAETSAPSIRFLTWLLGLTYLHEPVNAWFFGADPFLKTRLVPLIFQCLVYAGLAVLAWQRVLRRI